MQKSLVWLSFSVFCYHVIFIRKLRSNGHLTYIISSYFQVCIWCWLYGRSTWLWSQHLPSCLDCLHILFCVMLGLHRSHEVFRGSQLCYYIFGENFALSANNSITHHSRENSLNEVVKSSKIALNLQIYNIFDELAGSLLIGQWS